MYVSSYVVSFPLTDRDHKSYTLLTIPRARRVHQSLLSTPPTALRSLVTCLYHLMVRPRKSGGRSTFADVLLLNGPGTCLMLCIAVYVNKVGLRNSAFLCEVHH